ncbi:MAG: hypothetical protein K1X28_00185 [Parachlamydiales bacterium]|nr:hypothetical protein [Parachlamydiales bacterium]
MAIPAQYTRIIESTYGEILGIDQKFGEKQKMIHLKDGNPITKAVFDQTFIDAVYGGKTIQAQIQTITTEMPMAGNDDAYRYVNVSEVFRYVITTPPSQ